MKRSLILKLALLALSIFLIVGVVSCDKLTSFFNLLGAPQGYVVVAQTGKGLANATVTLTPKAQSVPPLTDSKTQEKIAADEAQRVVITTTTNADGYYTFTDVDYGTYILTAETTGYGFTKQIVVVSGLAQWLPSVAALPDDGVIRIVTMWSPDFKDVDVALSYDADYTTSVAFADNYQIAAESGFSPENGATGRELIYFNKKASTDEFPTGTPVIALDVDNRGAAADIPGGPETISIRYAPTKGVALAGTSTTVNATHSAWSKLPVSTFPYYWVNTMSFYLDAFSRTSATTGDDAPLVSPTGDADAGVIVYVMQGKNMLGAYKLPEFTTIDSASILRINTFIVDEGSGDGANVFQIVPDIRVMTVTNASGFRDLGMSEDGIIVVSTPGRK